MLHYKAGVLTGISSPATRAKALNLHNIRRMNLIKFIVFIIYILGLGFISSAAILQFGLGLSTTTRCRSAILMCLVFYVGGKVCVYLFLVERIHAIRATVYKRFKDWAWVTSMLVVVLGFGAIAVVAFLKPLFELSERDGKCRIGLPSKLLAGLLAYDVGVNIAMTVWFFMLVRPYLVSGLPNVIPTFVQKGCKKIRVLINKQTKTACTTSGADTACSSIVRLMSKSFIGSVGVLITTIINLSVLLHMQGREQAWLCFSLCTTDSGFSTIFCYPSCSPANESSSLQSFAMS